MRFIILSCILLAFACGSHSVDINEQIDGILSEFNTFLASKKLDATLIPDFKFPTAPVFNGVILRDLTTLYRTGDGRIWKDGDNLRIKMNVGLKDMRINIFQATYMRSPAALTFERASAEIRVSLYPDENGSCKTSWDYIKLTTLGYATSYSLNKEYDGKPFVILKDLIPFYNKHLNGSEKYSIKGLNNYINLCEQNAVDSLFKQYKN
ncbi:hypothetical protein O3M35_011801 [Rhynocoris fuscipes]|uniref:Lipoprotein n=1 Tax=Rhynocoris fuscipes TaxID=488301 RepID=A0AAW1CXI5_9HEMI